MPRESIGTIQSIPLKNSNQIKTLTYTKIFKRSLESIKEEFYFIFFTLVESNWFSILSYSHQSKPEICFLLFLQKVQIHKILYIKWRNINLCYDLKDVSVIIYPCNHHVYMCGQLSFYKTRKHTWFIRQQYSMLCFGWKI